MNRNEVYREIEEMFGFVPTFLKSIPDSSLELEWKLFKRVQFDPGPIPNRKGFLNPPSDSVLSSESGCYSILLFTNGCMQFTM